MSARAYKFNKKRQLEYFEHLRQGLRPGAAAEAVGITRQTVYMHRKNDPDFAEAERLAEREACEIVEDALFNAAISGNVKAAETWLYNRMPDRWTDKRTPNIVNQIEAKQEVTNIVDIKRRDLARRVLADPEASRLACDLAERLGGVPGADPDGMGQDGESRVVDPGEAPGDAQS